MIKTQQRKQQSSGFTLLEMSIVMGLIAFLVGAVVAGKELLEIARSNKLATQIENIQGATKLFENKYQCMPGDCADPTAISGFTYAGNGNGYLANTWNDDENKGFWVHLKASNLLQDALVAHANASMAGMMVPQLQQNTGSVINAYGSITFGQNILMIASTDSTGGVTVKDAIYLDEKLDDGIAASGVIRTTGYDNIYAAPPAFPLAITNYNGSTRCVTSGVYVSGTSRCNLTVILER